MHTIARRRFRLTVPAFVVVAVLSTVLVAVLLLTANGASSDATPPADLRVRATDAGVNSWSANDPAVLLESVGAAALLPSADELP